MRALGDNYFIGNKFFKLKNNNKTIEKLAPTGFYTWIKGALTFDFNEGTLNVDAEGYIYYGQWSSSQASDGAVTITISDLENNIANFNGDWLVIECEPEKIVLSNGVDEIMFEQECQ